LDAEDQILF